MNILELFSVGLILAAFALIAIIYYITAPHEAGTKRGDMEL